MFHTPYCMLMRIQRVSVQTLVNQDSYESTAAVDSQPCRCSQLRKGVGMGEDPMEIFRKLQDQQRVRAVTARMAAEEVDAVQHSVEVKAPQDVKRLLEILTKQAVPSQPFYGPSKKKRRFLDEPLWIHTKTHQSWFLSSWTDHEHSGGVMLLLDDGSLAFGRNISRDQPKNTVVSDGPGWTGDVGPNNQPRPFAHQISVEVDGDYLVLGRSAEESARYFLHVVNHNIEYYS